jgi:glycosyltransferase involved in cell wall biosynthesis
MNPSTLQAKPIGVVIPAFQAENTLAVVLEGVLSALPPDHIVVVDDGSSDATSDMAKTKGVVCLRHPENRGKGAALMTGFSQARQLGWEWAITLDADGQHPSEDLGHFLNASPGSRVGILVGRRARKGTNMPWHRRFSNAVTTWIISRMAGKPVFDAQCGFRAYRISLMDAYAREGRFEWEAQALVLCCRKGFEVEAVPVSTVYAHHGSHMRLGRDTWRFLRMIRRLAWTY